MPKIQQILRISKHNNLNVNALALVFAVFFAQSILAQIPKNGLVAYYPFTGNANDSSGNGYHGTTSNVTLVKDRFGRSNCAYSFSGNINSNIEIPSTGLKNNNYSYSVWIKINSLGANGTNSAVFEVGQGGNATGQCISVANNYLGTSKGITGGGYNKTATPSGWVVSTKTIPSTSPWYHVVFARGNDFQYLYIDGVLKDSFKTTTPLQPEYGNPVKAFFGIRCNYIQPFNGIIDDASLYNRVITPCEVTELYTGINPNRKPNGFTKAILHRACLDKVSGQLDLKFTPSKDTFSKFVFYRVWGKDDSTGNFKLLHEDYNRRKPYFTLSPPSKKKWELYISTHWNTCEGTDSLISNTLFVDDVAPLYVEPDSVSVDIQTQQVYAGWTSPAVADLLGYKLFKVDDQGNNLLIDEKNVLNYTFNGNTFNSSTSGNRLAIAAYDSCRNVGLISKFHSPMVLSYNLDDNYLCNNTIRFQWTKYVGWTTGSHLLIVEDTDANKVIGSINLSGLDSSLVWKLPYFGMNIRVYVRSFKSGNTSISSTSNVITAFISKVAGPNTPNPNRKPNGFTKAILHRACLDKVSGQLDLKITPSNDTFSKFVFYRVWGKDNASGTFQLLHKGLTRNKQLFTLFPPSKKKWELYISTHWNTCSGTDSLISNTLFVDDVAPLYVEPDSVSVDIQTQQVYAGWTSPPVADILGYSLFKVDAQGNNQLIDEKNVLNYTFNGNTFNPLSSGNRLAIAAYDSCRNGGIISKYHSPMVLFYKLDNNYLCNNTIRFQWTNYVGWTTESHLLIIEDADANKVIGSINLSGLESSLDWTLPYLGMNIRVYVRAFKFGNASISSTSNVINTFISKAADLTTATQLDWISVESEPKIELSGRKNMGDSGLLLYRDVGATNWTLAKTITKNTVNFNYTHSASNSSNKLTEFVLKRFNPCGIVVDSSVIQRNILLQKSGTKDLVFTPHEGWNTAGISYQYQLEHFDNGTWNSVDTKLGSSTDLLFTATGFGVRQFRVKASTNAPIFNLLNWSTSNVITLDLGFDSSQYDTFLIPNAFTPGGKNPVFKISNPAVLPGEAKLYIYNRWGEIFFRGDALLGWDGTDGKGELVADETYVYIVEARYRRKIKRLSGTISVFK